MANIDSRTTMTFERFIRNISKNDNELRIGLVFSGIAPHIVIKDKSETEIRQFFVENFRLDNAGTKQLIKLNDAEIRDILLKCGVDASEVSKMSGDALKRYAVNLIGDTSVMVSSEPKHTPERDVRKEETKPVAKVGKIETTAGGKSRAKFVAENADDTLILILNEYINTCDANPAQSAETLFTKIAQLKAEYMKVAAENGLTDTPKYGYIMNIIKVFESFPRFVDDPTKGNAINMGNKRKHYTSLMPQIKGRANTLRVSLSSFDRIEDKELAEEAKSRPSETETRREIVRNIAPNMIEVLEEFNKNFMSNPARSAETLLVKLAQLKRQYMVAATLVNGAKATSEHKLVMKCFEKILDNPNYTLCEGSESEKKEHYEIFAWDIKNDVSKIVRKLEDFLVDVQD